MLKAFSLGRNLLLKPCRMVTIPKKQMTVLVSGSALKTLDLNVASTPHSDALKMACDGAKPIKFTYRQLSKQVDAFANGIHEIPFKAPAIMVIWGKDCAETFVAQLGAMKAGVNVIYLDETAEELHFVKALKTGARWLVVSPTVRPQLEALNLVNKYFPELLGTENHNRVIRNFDFPSLRYIFSTGFERYPGMVPFAHMLTYLADGAPNANYGSVCYYGKETIKEHDLPYLDPNAKLSENIPDI